VEIITYRAFVRKETIIPLKIMIGVGCLLFPVKLNNIEIKIGKVTPSELMLIQLKIEKFLCCSIYVRVAGFWVISGLTKKVTNFI